MPKYVRNCCNGVALMMFLIDFLLLSNRTVFMATAHVPEQYCSIADTVLIVIGALLLSGNFDISLATSQHITTNKHKHV
jgi:hypothetical protein